MIKVSQVSFSELIQDVPTYCIYWSKGKNEYISSVSVLIKENGSESYLITNHSKLLEPKRYSLKKARISKTFDGIRAIEKQLKEAFKQLKLEDDFYHARAHNEILTYPENERLKKWMELYEYNKNSFLEEYEAQRRMDGCKFIYEQIINKYGSFNNFENELDEMDII